MVWALACALSVPTWCATVSLCSECESANEGKQVPHAHSRVTHRPTRQRESELSTISVTEVGQIHKSESAQSWSRMAKSGGRTCLCGPHPGARRAVDDVAKNETRVLPFQ
jgi:hypothetical protein